MKRWTMEELASESEIGIIREILQERIQGLNQFAPLSRKVKEIDARLANLEKVHAGATKFISATDKALDRIRDDVKDWLHKKP